MKRGLFLIKTNLNRYEYLDVARALAAMLVILQHLLEVKSAYCRAFLEQYFNFGIMGVTIFFLVSGAIIPPSIQRVGVLRFWVARVFRLYPLYWISILLVIVLWNQEIQPSDLLWNMTMLQEFVGHKHLMPPYWTLSMEMVFYVLCTVLIGCGLIRRIGVAGVSIAGIGAFFCLTAFAALTKTSIPIGRVHVILASLIGFSLVAPAWMNLSIKAKASISIGLALLLGFAAYTRFDWLVPDREVTEAHFSAFCVFISWVVGYVIFIGLHVFRDIRFPRLLVRSGTYCYSSYLLHPFLLGFLPESIPIAIRFVLILAILFVVGDLVWRYIESPAIKLGKKVSGIVSYR